MAHVGTGADDGRPSPPPAALFAALAQAATGYLVVATDPTGTITTFTEGAEQMLGYRADEVVGTATLALYHDPHELQTRAAALHVDPGPEALLCTARRAGADVRPWTLVRKDGSRLPVSCAVSAVRDASGTLTGFLAVAHDLTADGQSAEQVRVTGDLRRLFMGAPVPTLIAGLADARVRLANEAAAEALGITTENLVGRRTDEIGLWPDLEARRGMLDEIRATGRVRNLEVRLTRADGDHTLVADLAPIDFDGEDCVIGTFLDISARSHVEDALRESEERLRQFGDHVDVGFFLRSVDPFRFLYVNRQLEGIYGVPRERILSDPQSVFAYVLPDDIGTVRETIRTAQERGEPQQMEYRLRHDERGERWVRVRLSPVSLVDGRPTRMAGTVEDVTDQKAAQAALRSAQVDAEQANLAKSEFLSRISHELRTPLNAIIGFGQLLEMDDLTAEQREAVNHMLVGGRHLLELINEVLDISRIESGRLHLSLEPVRLGEVVDEVLALVRPQADERAVRLPAGPGVPDTAHVVADRQRLAQVLLNLVSNAVKYNREDGEVWITSDTKQERRLALSVRDSGIGIPADRMDDLFTPFDRLGAEQTGIEGTGLGLALTKRLMEAMHGAVSVQSTSAGTTVTVELERCPPPDSGSVAGARDTVSTDGSQGHHTVLYIEDNGANVQLVERVMATVGGVELRVAGEGLAALHAARRDPPDLVLLDVNLPDIDGAEVLARLRAEPATRDVPVIAVSADASPGQHRRMLAAGASGYVTKPFDVVHLRQLVQDRLASAPREDSTR
ncbi:MAG: PAS domain-containing hybrid sensor histidine kinase/response regulator [Actinomycetes bacterium]